MLLENNINLSIIIPIFNEEKYLKPLFSDIKKYFNFNNIEVIAVNDGSDDETKIILEEIRKKEKNFSFNIINLDQNYGKGYAVQQGIKNSLGKYILLQDADLELDIKDSREIYDTISNDENIDCIFGSRYLSGKLNSHNYFINEFIGKFNTLIFNLLYGQSLSDIHCGLKIFHRNVLNEITLSINDFGLEIDIASQIIKKNFNIYEVGVSYFSRTVESGKKITWTDGLKSYYYFFKTRFIDNSISTQISIIISSFYMTCIGSYFGFGIDKVFFIIAFLCMGLIIGLNTKILSTLLILLFIYIALIFNIFEVKFIYIVLLFLFGIFIIVKLRMKITKRYPRFINLF